MKQRKVIPISNLDHYKDWRVVSVFEDKLHTSCKYCGVQTGYYDPYEPCPRTLNAHVFESVKQRQINAIIEIDSSAD